MGYIFDPEHLQQIGQTGVGLPHEEMCRVVIEGLAAAYPGHIETKQDWIFNLAAGATGIMTVLHGSLSEYIIIFGSAVGTEAFSGRYHVDIYDTMLAGEMWTYTEENFREKTTHLPGEMALLKRGTAKGFKTREGSWMLEYGRGLVPTALPIGLGDAVLAMDGVTVWKTLRNYGRLVTRELLQGKI
ncbi:MAG: isomerase [Myxococcales bacterium]|nr:isomerase [Myxococcales bacterium]